MLGRVHLSPTFSPWHQQSSTSPHAQVTSTGANPESPGQGRSRPCRRSSHPPPIRLPNPTSPRIRRLIALHSLPLGIFLSRGCSHLRAARPAAFRLGATILTLDPRSIRLQPIFDFRTSTPPPEESLVAAEWGRESTDIERSKPFIPVLFPCREQRHSRPTRPASPSLSTSQSAAFEGSNPFLRYVFFSAGKIKPPAASEAGGHQHGQSITLEGSNPFLPPVFPFAGETNSPGDTQDQPALSLRNPPLLRDQSHFFPFSSPAPGGSADATTSQLQATGPNTSSPFDLSPPNQFRISK